MSIGGDESRLQVLLYISCFSLSYWKQPQHMLQKCFTWTSAVVLCKPIIFLAFKIVICQIAAADSIFYSRTPVWVGVPNTPVIQTFCLRRGATKKKVRLKGRGAKKELFQREDELREGGHTKTQCI